MCGRVRLSSDVSEIKLVFSIPPERPAPNIAPSWNVAPTDPLPIVHYDAKATQRSLDMLRWGLIPYWPRTSRSASPTSMPRPRGSRTSPHSAKRSSAGAALADRGIMALAGLWENWHSPAGEWVRSFAIVTTVPNQLCAEIHNRMPETRCVAGVARRGRTGGRAAAQSAAVPLPRRRHDLLAGQRARRECQE
jgi:putative SOS response-associated peptidase YedK